MFMAKRTHHRASPGKGLEEFQPLIPGPGPRARIRFAKSLNASTSRKVIICSLSLEKNRSNQCYFGLFAASQGLVQIHRGA
jgi:hypothetical protein